MERWAVFTALAVCAGCYHPAAETSCAITCGTDSPPCPGNLTCISGLCRTGPDDTCGAPAMPDAALPPMDGPSMPGDAACATFGTALFTWQKCPAPTDAIAISGTFNTDTQCTGLHHTVVTVTGGSACVIYAHHIDVVSPGLRAIGSRPLVLAADTLAIEDGIEVSGQFGTTGAGTDFNCSTATSSDGTGAGGPGGSSGFKGGAGGAGNGSTRAAGSAESPNNALHGGCPGATGSNGSIAAGAGAGGPGGGVMYLIGRTSIALGSASVVVYLDAGGAGGHGGGTGGLGGGGGGGAGGMVAFDTPGFVFTGMGTKICANGGGGGGGGDDNISGVGSGGNGGDGCAVTNGGGQGVFGGGTGGGGSTGNGGTDGSAAVTGAGGGGGGGGAGYVLVFGGATAGSLNQNVTASPLAQ